VRRDDERLDLNHQERPHCWSDTRHPGEEWRAPIRVYDLLVAGQALRGRLTVVTANTSEFSRVSGLSWQDWTA
jgi:predicted nucleic acid-binding protein